MPTAITLVSHLLCPSVQRIAIILAEKGVVHDRISVDLSKKPGRRAAFAARPLVQAAAGADCGDWVDTFLMCRGGALSWMIKCCDLVVAVSA